jgi:single-strand DNA-binding protein
MASVNKVIIVGNLGRDPEVRYNPERRRLVHRVDRHLAQLEGQDFRREGRGDRVAPRRLQRPSAEIAGEYLKKGRSVYVEGRLKTRKWTDKDGAEKFTTEIIAQEMQMLGSREGMGGGGDDASYSGGGGGGGGGYERPAPAARPAGGAKPAAKSSTGFDNMDDDIPF